MMEPKRPIVFTGSSIIAMWEGFPARFAGLPTVNTAIGGTQTHDLLPKLDELVLRHNPSAVCYYCGSNDLNELVSPVTIVANVTASFRIIHARVPDARFIYLAIIKAPQKADRWDRVDEVNKALKSFAAITDGFDFIDINPVFFDAAGVPVQDFYVEDGLHLTPAAYAALNAFLEPRLGFLLLG